jgi:hypothetical protein
VGIGTAPERGLVERRPNYHIETIGRILTRSLNENPQFRDAPSGLSNTHREVPPGVRAESGPTEFTVTLACFLRRSLQSGRALGVRR